MLSNYGLQRTGYSKTLRSPRFRHWSNLCSEAAQMNKTLTRFLRILLVLSILIPSAWVQNHRAAAAATEDARIARLIGLAKAWGTVKYFHPYLAYRDIDWDK